MDNSLNFTVSDSFALNLLQKMEQNKKILAELSEEVNDDGKNKIDSEVMNIDEHGGPHSSTMMMNQTSVEQNDIGVDDNDEELLANYSTIEINKARKSINRLLNVYVPLDLNDDNDDVDAIPEDNKKRNDNRLRHRLDKLSAIYRDDDDVENVENDMVANRPKTIMREQQNFADEFQPPRRIELRDRLKIIADSYYPITSNKEDSPLKFQAKIASPKSQPAIEQPKFTAKNENLFKSKSLLYEQQDLKSIENQSKPPIIIEKRKTSVANLKQLFEKKMTENDHIKELEPELLPVREKKRLFEKAIREENEAKAKQYRKVGRLPGTWPLPPSLPEHENDYHQSPKRIKEHLQNEFGDDEHEKIIKKLEKNIENVEDEEEVSLIFDQSSEIVQEVCKTFKSIDEIHMNDDNEQEQVSAKQEIDDDNVVDVDEEEIMELTFTAIDHEENENFDDNFQEITADNDDSQDSNLIHRSSTRVHLSISDSDITEDRSSSTSSSVSLPPEKPQRLFLYEHEQKDDTSESGTEDNVEEITPQIRTISFYREQQRKLREEQQMAKMNKDKLSDATKQAIHFQQNIDVEHEDREQFSLDCQSKMIALKDEINEHDRVLSQANTALNLSLSMAELRNSDSRVEAERLLLVSNEKIDACRSEIHRLQLMIANADHYMQRTIEKNISTGTLYIDHIKLPLLNEFIQERAKGKLNSVFHFICLVCVGPSVFVSKLLDTAANLSKSYLEFDMGLAIDSLSEDFKVTVKVFALELSLKECGGHKYRFANSPFKTIRRRLMHSSSSASTSPMSKNSPIIQRNNQQQKAPASNFRLIGYVKLTLQNVKANANKFYRLDSDCFIPIIDSYLTMNVSIKVAHGNHFPGFYDIKEKEDSFWNVRYFRLHGEHLRYYRFGEEKNVDQPLGLINLKHCINPKVEFLKVEHRHLCRRSNSFVLVIVDPPAVSNAKKLITGGTITRIEPKLYYISSQSEPDCLKFCSLLNKILHSIRIWERDAVQPYSREEFDRLLSNIQ
nr:uncharacterized protein LOC124491304 [Dermatophagoides farinae]